MKLVHYFDRVRLEEGGTVRAALDISAAMAARGHEVTLLTYDATDAPPGWEGGGVGTPRIVKVDPPARPGRFFDAQQLRALEPLIRDADAVHLHGLWVPSNPQIARLCRDAGVPYIVSIHGMLHAWAMSQKRLKKRLYLLLQGRTMLGRASVLHATTPGELDQARPWFPDANWQVVPSIVDLSVFHELPGPEDARRAFGIEHDSVLGVNTPPVVLFLSRVHYVKRPEILVDACALLAQRGVEHRLLIAGTGDAAYTQTIRERAERAGIGGRTSFLGMVSGRLKVSLYQAADVFALPTSQENFGLVYAESLAAGTPVVGTRGADTWRDLESGGGAIIPDDTPAGFADAIEKLLRDAALRDRMGRSGRAWVFSALNDRHVAGLFEGMYERARAVRGTAELPLAR